MKKIVAVLASVLMCSNAVADPIDAERAKVLAQEFLVPGHVMTLVKSADRNEARARRVSAAVAATSPYYVFSRGEGKGFVIVAGDDCLPTILGYTEQGDWNDATVPAALADMLEYHAQCVENAQINGTNKSVAAEARQRRALSTKANIAPFVTAHWHQSSPYNDNCPVLKGTNNKALTGCVATAASQILHYWRKDLPATLQATTPTYGYGDAPVTRSVPKGTPLKWDLMKDSYGNEPVEYKQAVAEFVFATGAATWLTYGSSTSGNIENIPNTFSTYFGMNGGTVHYRDSYSQTSWSNLLYNELANGRPVMYTGVHPDNGGHAVFIHGYQASTDLFYFNFGWGAGNGYDGYYTTDQTKGMNGFNGSQSALIGAYPKSWNVDVNVDVPDAVYAYCSDTYKVTLKNNSTLPIQGVRMYFSNSATSRDSKYLKDSRDVVVGVGDSYSFTADVKTTSTGKNYITITDGNGNVMSQIKVDAGTADMAQLKLKDMRVNSSSETESVGGADYAVVYNNSKAAITLRLVNKGNVAYERSLRCMLFSSIDNGMTWDEGTAKSVSVEVPGGADVENVYNFLNLKTGVLYKVSFVDELSNLSSNYHLDMSELKDAAVYFTLKDADMAVESFENGVIKCTGHWDTNIYNSVSVIAGSKYKTHKAVDLTEVTGVFAVPDNSVNPNAVIYVSGESEAYGKNVIKAGKCDSLVLVPGYDFAPSADFSAGVATLEVGDEVGVWYLLTCPFNADVPDGIIARTIDSHKAGSISGRVTDVKTLEAGKTYMVMLSSAENKFVSGKNTAVSAIPSENSDTAVVGTYAGVKVPSSAFLLFNDYFEPVGEGSVAEALRGYFCASDVTARFRAYPSITMDPVYVSLAEAICESYGILADNKDTSTDEAYSMFYGKIKEAEMEFSNRGVTSLTTASAVKKYVTDLLASGDEYAKTFYLSANKTIDFTSLIDNPSFEPTSATSTLGRTKGWTYGTSETGSAGSTIVKAYANSNDNYFTSGADGNFILYNKYKFTDEDGTVRQLGVEMSQTLTGLTPGYYRISVKVTSDEGNTVTVFAGDSVSTVETHPFGVHYFADAVVDSVLVLASDGLETGELTIGVKAGDWYKADDFRISYIASSLSDEEVTRIESVGDETKRYSATGVYNLQGIKMQEIKAPGVYVIDGKKMSIK